jgi:uncharacterized protein (DUF1778 family)
MWTSNCEYIPSTKDDRLQVRVDPAEKRLIERAAEASHLSASAFVVQAAATRAEEVLAHRQTIRVGEEAARALTEALIRRAAVIERLAEALRRPRKFRWLD